MADLTLTYVSGREWRVAEPFHIVWGGRNLQVPEGTRTDLASVPWWGRWFVSVSGAWNRGAVAHDYLYQQRPEDWTRAEADRLLHDVAWRDGTGAFKACVIWVFVRVGGPRW